jgi:hypothetical protein
MSKASPQFDFDEWANLARTDALAFERRRHRMLQSVIEQAGPDHQRRLRGLQFQVDMERRRARTPLQACMRISAMMWDSVLARNGLRQALESLQDSLLQPSLPPAPTAAGPSAQIIPFPPRPR